MRNLNCYATRFRIHRDNGVVTRHGTSPERAHEHLKAFMYPIWDLRRMGMVRKLVTAVKMKYGSPFFAACRGRPGIVAGSTPPWGG